jgi:hypothetical protein
MGEGGGALVDQARGGAGARRPQRASGGAGSRSGGVVAWDRDVEVEWGLGLRACMGWLVWAGLKEQ